MNKGLIDHIPPAYRFRGYGCGSPVLDAHIAEGDRVADLGCGAGVECFIAARLSGPSGRVWGIYMLDPMLALVANVAGAQAWSPQKNVEIVVPNPPGGKVEF